jgi:hypothetical protein
VPDVDNNIIAASPTKEFFISMLVRDIELLDAVADLVDNCVDGARRISKRDSFASLHVRIHLSEKKFEIEDNCGGISVDIARKYAFRFGRPGEFPPTKHSIGQFGIGMKRALFKMGDKFRVESATKQSRFVVEVPVDEWKKQPEKDKDGQNNGNWQFEFAELDEDKDKTFKPGTTITVTRLHDGVAAQFGLENFKTRLAGKLTSTHQYSLTKGLEISVGETKLTADPITLLSSEAIKPVHQRVALPLGLRVGIFAGLARSEPEKAGWYIFCNGRLILEADQTERTGWGEGHGKKIPRFHNQFARFHGYVFFDADKPGLLPWNTTKTDVDYNSATYQDIRGKMIVAMRPIIDFLNDLDQENTEAKVSGPGILAKAVAKTGYKQLKQLKVRAKFSAPAREIRKSQKISKRISYERPISQVARVKSALDAKSLREVGEGTFDYYYRVACKG